MRRPWPVEAAEAVARPAERRVARLDCGEEDSLVRDCFSDEWVTDFVFLRGPKNTQCYPLGLLDEDRMRILPQQSCRVLCWREAVGTDNYVQTAVPHEPIPRHYAFDEGNKKTRITARDRSKVDDQSLCARRVRGFQHALQECVDRLATFAPQLNEPDVNRPVSGVDGVGITLLLSDYCSSIRPRRRRGRFCAAESQQNKSSSSNRVHDRSHGNGRGRGQGQGHGSKEFLPASPLTAASRTCGSPELKS